MYPLLTGIHIPDKKVCVPPDIFIGIHNTAVKGNESKQEASKQLKNLFVKKLLQSNSNQAGSKCFVSRSFIAYPEKYLESPLVIDGLLINNNQQILIQVKENNSSAIIDVQSTICNMLGKDYCRSSSRECSEIGIESCIVVKKKQCLW